MNLEEAILEANKCLSCKKPMCSIKGCPAHNPTMEFIAEVKNGNIDKAKEILYTNTNCSLPCSIVCDAARQCVGSCIKGIKGEPVKINELEEFVNKNSKYTFGKTGANANVKVFVVGAGPAGLSCAIELAKNGARVDVYDKNPVAGGLLAYGIPGYRLHKDDLAKYVKEVTDLGVNIILNKNLTGNEVKEMLNSYDYGVIACGLGSGKSLRIENINAEGVYEGLEFIHALNEGLNYDESKLIKLTGTTHVVGAGNSAMDAARLALLAGSDEVYITYRRTLAESPAAKKEILEAEENGVKFNFLHNPSKVITENGKIVKLECEVMELGEPDESGRRSPVGTGVYEEYKCDNLILAIGQGSEASFVNELGITLDHGYIVCNEELATSNEKLYACGDVELGAATVVKAMVNGKKVAQNILKKVL